MTRSCKGTIKIKSPWPFVHLVRQDQVNSARNTDHAARVCERFVYSRVKITRLYDYQTWQTHLFEKFTRCAKVCGLFFLTVLFGCRLAGQVNCDHTVYLQGRKLSPFKHLGWSNFLLGQQKIALLRQVNILSPGQTDSQFSLRFVWPPLAWTCIDLHRLALTLVLR